jgi:hypothetical protein
VEGSLTTAIHKLRKALGDDDASLIVTAPRVGYRLAAHAHSSYGRKSAFPAELTVETGQPVPGRAQWILARPLDASSNSEVWLAEHPKTRELRVFKFVADGSRLATLKREVTVFRFLRESLGERADFVRIFEWNFDQHPYFLESEYGGPNLAQWAESQGGLAKVHLQSRLGMVANIAQTVAAAHAAHFLRLAEQVEAGLRGPGHAHWLEVMRAENANVRGALDWLIHADDYTDGALTLAGSLGMYWHMGRHLEGRETLRRVLALPGGSPQARARALQAVSLVERPRACLVHPSAQCAAAADESLQIFEAIGDRRRADLVARVKRAARHERHAQCLEVRAAHAVRRVAPSNAACAPRVLRGRRLAGTVFGQCHLRLRRRVALREDCRPSL